MKPSEEYMKNMRKDAPVQKVSSAREKAIEQKVGLQLISIRLQKTLVDQLKALAKEEGIGYQPYIRQILTKYVREKSDKRLKSIGE